MKKSGLAETNNNHASVREAMPQTGSTIVTLFGLVCIAWSFGLIIVGIWQLGDQTAVGGRNPATFTDVPNVTSGVFDYGGGTAWAPLRLAVDSIIQSQRPELKLRYVQLNSVPPGSSPGIEMLLMEQLAFVQSSRPLLAQEYDWAREKGLTLKQIPVAVDGIVVAVHPDLNIPGLTVKQLAKIYTGQITNWQQLGGPNLEITPYSRFASTGGIVEIFTAKILDQDFGDKVEFVSTTTEALRQLADNPGGIYYGSAPSILPQCTIKTLPIGTQPDNFVAPYQKPIPKSECPARRHQPNRNAFRKAEYPLTYYLYVVFIEKPDQISIGQTYADFLLTSQGQKLIAKAGFVPLN